MSPFRPLLGIICLGYSVNKQLGSCGAISERCFQLFANNNHQTRKVQFTEHANEPAAPEVQYLESAADYSGDERDVCTS